MTDLNVILAEQEGLGRIYLCGCNSVHVTVGPVTVVLSLDAFLQTATLVDHARNQIAEITAERTLEDSRIALSGSTLTH